MPSKLKKLVRERMARTGERYATALRHVRAQHSDQHVNEGALETPPTRGDYEADLIVARYFGRTVTFAIMPVGGRCLLSVAPGAGQPITQTPRMHWRLLHGRGAQ
ncbi:MAG TPA: hypothetical protein VFZ61_02550 [Polyangiales bacterium]